MEAIEEENATEKDLSLRAIEKRLVDNPMIAEQFGRYLADNLYLKLNKARRYDVKGGDKTNIGLAKTILRWIKDYFD